MANSYCTVCSCFIIGKDIHKLYLVQCYFVSVNCCCLGLVKNMVVVCVLKILPSLNRLKLYKYCAFTRLLGRMRVEYANFSHALAWGMLQAFRSFCSANRRGFKRIRMEKIGAEALISLITSCTCVCRL